MEHLHQLADVALHLDRHLEWLVANYGVWVYAILFAIVFCETGLVVTPFLPGDSLLFVTGAIAAAGGIDFPTMACLLIIAAVLGDSANYAIGHYLGPRVFRSASGPWLNRNHLQRAHDFYVRHGGKAIVLARFVPIVRTFVPFVAGIGAMRYARFFAYNVCGALLWVLALLGAGYLFGNIAWVKQNLTAVILGIIVLSLLPIAIEYLRQRKSPAG